MTYVWRKLFFAALICATFFCFFNEAAATTLEARPLTIVRNTGETFTVSLYVTTSGTAVNAVSGALVFPRDTVDFVSVSREGSVVSIWPEEPVYKDLSDTGSVNFEGVILGGFSGKEGKIVSVVLRAKKPGVADLKITEASVLANDGLGTNLLATIIPSTLTIKAKLPEAAVPKIVSTTHPDQAGWYAKSSATFSWAVPKDVSFVAHAFDAAPGTIPSEGGSTVSTYTTSMLSDGVWYMHVRFKDAKGVFGPTSHYKIQIDTVRPENITVQEVEAASETTLGTKYFALDAFDALSGIARYEISVDDTKVDDVSASSKVIRSVTGLRPGNSALKVVAYDAAGNFITFEKNIAVAGFDAPTIRYVADAIVPGSPIVVSGNTAPNATVRIYREKVTGSFFGRSREYFRRKELSEASLVGTTVSDLAGVYHFVSSDGLGAGAYIVYAVAVKQNGIQSELSDSVFVRASYLYSLHVLALGALGLILAFGTIFLWVVVRKNRSHGRLKDAFAVSKVHSAIDNLTVDLQEKARELDEKIRAGKHLTPVDKELLGILLERSAIE